MKQSFVLIWLLAVNSLAADPAALRLVQTIPLPNVEGRIDHMAVDVPGQRLFVAALGNNSVEVVDLRTGKRSHSLGGFHEPQGVAWISGRGQLFVASGGDEMCHVLDGTSFAAIAVGGQIDDADNVRYDAAAHRVYVGCGSGSLWVFDATKWTIGGAIPLPGASRVVPTGNARPAYLCQHSRLSLRPSRRPQPNTGCQFVAAEERGRQLSRWHWTNNVATFCSAAASPRCCSSSMLSQARRSPT